MTDRPPAPDVSAGNYDVMLEQIDRTIDTLVEKIEDGRISDPEREKVRLKQYRALGYLIRTKRKVLEDKTLEELAAEVEALKAVRENGAAGAADVEL